MDNGKERFVTVTLDTQPEGINLSGWFSTADFWASEKARYPHYYFYSGEGCKWNIHCNAELTIKARAMIIEYIDKICREAEAKNSRRKIANRS